VSYLGDRMFDASGRMQPGAWPILGVLSAVSITVALVARHLERRRARADGADATTRAAGGDAAT